jgi:methionyl-tRNA synthetase
VLRNYKQLQGYDTKFLTGADEHGQKIEIKSKENNLSPQVYVDLMSNKFVDL